MRTRVAIALLALGLVPVLAQAQNKKGVQAVLLQCWSPASLNRFIAVVQQAPAQTIEIGVAPYNPNCALYAGTTDRYQNLRTVIGALRSHGKLRITLHIGDIHETKPTQTALGSRMLDSWNLLIGRYVGDGQVSFHISPSLEDSYDKTEYKTALDKLVERLDVNSIRSLVAQGRFSFRRSSMNSVDLTLKTHSIFRNAPGGAVAVPVINEYHKATAPVNPGVWSNDGCMVYYSEAEHHTHHDDANDDILDTNPQTSLAAFKRAAWSDYKLLWRPAYNVWERKVESGRIRFYRRSGVVRSDTAAGKFDATEAAGLAVFLAN